MSHLVLWVVVMSICCLLLSQQASIMVWALSIALLTSLICQYATPSLLTQIFLFTLLAICVVSLFSPLRQWLFSRFIMRRLSRHMPHMSATEREALEAGTVGWEGELLGGKPDLTRLYYLRPTQLTAQEQAFLDGPVNVLCRMIDDWDITHQRADLPPAIWEFIKCNKFLGMIIPKSYGGLEFSATAQMQVLVKLYGCSISVATTVSVPNSLGPAELLLKYGTEAQKNYYLPRLAAGEEIPCFALTAPNAGSDAASITDHGIVCRQEFQGQEVVGMRLTWNKRYITLCPVATLIGLAFRLFDPENLLGKGDDLGICCALIPASTPGVIKGRRHFPLNAAFMNGPTQGQDVFVPLDYLIGGPELAGSGWRMLMECLSAGRAISLPSSAAGGTQAVALASGAYARLRRQFQQPIAKFEGIEEPLTRIAANTYLINAALNFTTTIIDNGAKPAVAGAILKYHTTERARHVINDAMDIHGGKGICLGPNNYLGRGYQNAPISITVEGANILSRSLIIFGQGAIRCHPYVLAQIESIRDNDLAKFDRAFWGHVSFVCANFIRSIGLAWTDARLIRRNHAHSWRYAQLLTRYSCHLAFLADFAMITLGGQLKRKEKISARLGDMLSNLYLLSGIFHRYHYEGEEEVDWPLVAWCCQQLLYECEQAMQDFIANYPLRWARSLLKVIVLPWGLCRHKPSDNLGHMVAELLTTPNPTRDRLTSLVFKEPLTHCALGKLEMAFSQIFDVENLEKIVLKAVKAGQIRSLTFSEQLHEALELGMLTKNDYQRLVAAERLRQQVIAVDDFISEELCSIAHITT